MSKEKKVYEHMNQNNEKTSYNIFSNAKSYNQGIRNYEGAVLKFSEKEAESLNLIPISEFEYVVEGAILRYTGGPYDGQLFMLQVTNNHSMYVGNKLVATKKDKEPVLNLKPLNGNPEIIIKEDWKHYTEDMKIEGNEALITTSTLKCEKGGTIVIITSGQTPISESVSEYSEKLMELAKNSADKEKTLKEMSEYLSKVYDENIVVEDFEYKKASIKPALDLIITGKEQWGGIDTTNVDIQNHIDEYNKNGVFFSERKKINRIRYVAAGSGEINSKIEKVPISGQYYASSDDYLLERNLSKEALYRLKTGFERNYVRELSTLKSHNETIEKIFQIDKKLNDGYTSENYKKELAKLMGHSNNYTFVVADSIAEQMLKMRKNITENIVIPEINLKILGLERKDDKLIVFVEDLYNDLNRRKYQKAINYYKDKGIEIKNTFSGKLSSFAHSFSESTNPNFDYDAEYIDGLSKRSINDMINGTKIVGGYVYYGANKLVRTNRIKSGKLKTYTYNSLEKNTNNILDINDMREFFKENKSMFFKNKTNIDDLTVSIAEVSLDNNQKKYLVAVNGTKDIKKNATTNFIYKGKDFEFVKKDNGWIKTYTNIYENGKENWNFNHAEKKMFGHIQEKYENYVSKIEMTVQNTDLVHSGVCNRCKNSVKNYSENNIYTPIKIYEGATD